MDWELLTTTMKTTRQEEPRRKQVGGKKGKIEGISDRWV